MRTNDKNRGVIMYKVLLSSVLSLILSFSLLNAYAYDHTFIVSGEDESGNSIEGFIYFNNNDSFLNGKIIDENGRVNEFRGEWGPAHVWYYN